MNEPNGEITEARLRCVCGFSIVCQVRPAVERIGFLAFFDDEPTSETYGERVQSCPSCGEQLGLVLLFGNNSISCFQDRGKDLVGLPD